ncbi:sensor histidine kinase [Paenibacillus thiaminolyticus]|nr:sensor histidine kinase [Paenibacillus thiaminolyticus]MCY9533521.1 sensor histidine kinase [Paenibacillus thiaminolyticus]MCY9604186.1 sensor histidine kinase [Paenibacillus thiaminolyticus]MCY9606266.1 sensor histidine kinase [Paenibacillus thiaminolyticus]MCY9612016.1 sensor histidine kinase [Paenibacillus thiaminolyticus]MCY9618037.1 sensor histidine kinase [Paenibacillus thiaminolyticus]
MLQEKIRTGLRYGLLVFPILGTVFMEDIASYGVYASYALGLLALVELRRFRLHETVHLALFVAELLYMVWFAHRYGGCLFLLFGSALASHPPDWTRGGHAAGASLALAALNVSMLGRDWEGALTANLALAALALLCLNEYVSRQDRRRLERLNDTLRQQTYELETARRNMVRYARTVEAAAQADERNRIAHELHDELGHKLIRLKLMLDAAEQIRSQDAERALELQGTVREQLAESMELLRITVRRMKPDESDIRAYSLERLVQSVNEEGRVRAVYRVAGLPCPLYPSIELALFHNAREAITNALRHGGATEVELTVQYEPDRVTLEVMNNGALPAQPVNAGMGLQGMEQRTGAVGGSIEWETEPRFVIRTRIPIASRI